MQIIFEEDDFNEMRDAMMGVIDFVPTDAQLRTVCENDLQLIGTALAWSWSDTEVRDALASALEKDSS